MHQGKGKSAEMYIIVIFFNSFTTVTVIKEQSSHPYIPYGLAPCMVKNTIIYFRKQKKAAMSAKVRSRYNHTCHTCAVVSIPVNLV